MNLACEIEKIEKFEDVLGADGSDEHPFAPVWKIMRYLHDELIPRCYRLVEFRSSIHLEC